MLEILNNLVAGILTAYLALTNTLADHLLSIIDDSKTDTAQTEVTDQIGVSELPLSAAETTESPVDFLAILADSAESQEAAVIAIGIVPNASSSNDVADDHASTTEVTDEVAGSVTVADALVNIYCTYRTESSIKATTGTGFFVEEKGVILTNAHVAMFLLLEDMAGKGTTKCVVRIGDPAAPKYYADLLYISPAWVSKNADVISSKKPTGTGERDYALLYVTDSIKNEPLPDRFPALMADTSLLDRYDRDNVVTIGGYPASEESKTIGSSLILSQSIATSSVTHIYTFGGKHGDLIALRGTNAGQKGMSGGPVVDELGHAVGLISTKGDEEENGAGSLNAITLSYIHRTLLDETGFGFTESITGNLPYRAKVFRENLQPFLTNYLAEEL